LAFGRNELIEFTLAFDRNHKELIKLNNVSPSNKLIVKYSDNPSTQSCPSAFQLIVASVVWLPNATSAHIKHPSSNKSSCASGFNCQFIVESDFEGAFIGSFINKFQNLIVKYSKREQLFSFSFVASINGFVSSFHWLW